MTVEANNPAIDDDDLDTTAPNPEPAAWTMPEPVFRKTSGRSAEAFESLAPPVPSSAEGSSQNDASGNASDAPIAPPPYVEPKPKSPALKIALIVLGLAAMIAFIAVFLTIIYFMFLRQTDPIIY